MKNVLSAKTRALNIARVREKFEARLKKAQEAQTKYYNKKHIPCTFEAGDKVYLNSKNIESTCLSKKLDYKYYRLFKIEELVGKQAYQLKLPQKMKIHNVFYVSLLELYTKTNNSNILVPPPIIVEGKDEYKVEKILDSQIHRGKLQYLVKWLGYTHNKDQWIIKSNVAGSSELTKMFHKIYLQKPTSKDESSQQERKRRRLK